MKETPRANLPFPGIKEIKQVELYTKWREYVPQYYKDEMCPKAELDIIKQQRLEKRERKQSDKRKLILLRQSTKRKTQSSRLSW
jgi:hypothetical protein